MRFVRQTVIDQAATGNINGGLMPAEYLFKASGQCISTGTIAGTFKLQFSNDAPQPGNAPPTHWSDIPAATAAILSAGTVAVLATDVCYSYLRGVLVYTSGTGNVTANINAFGF